MAYVLLVEDRPEEAKKKIRILESKSHEVAWVNEPSDPERYDKLRELLRERIWDILLLDIYLEDKFGGIHIYNKLIQGNYRMRWRHTFVWSQYTGPTISGAKYGQHEFPIRIFVETAAIPKDNVFSSMSGGPTPMLERIDEVMRQGTPLNCLWCESEL